MKLKYAVVYERTSNNYCAYAPELPGCVSTGRTWDEMQKMIREAIAFHIEDLKEKGEPVPVPHMSTGEAMTYHIKTLSEAEPVPDVPELETTVGMVEVETAVKLSRTA